MEFRRSQRLPSCVPRSRVGLGCASLAHASGWDVRPSLTRRVGIILGKTWEQQRSSVPNATLLLLSDIECVDQFLVTNDQRPVGDDRVSPDRTATSIG